MSIDSVINSSQIPTNSASGPTSALGKDDFLKLMLIQMQHQDPLDPMDNQAMLSQMAQFSSLEQMSNLNENFEKSIGNSDFLDATRLLGKDVTISNGDQGFINSKVKTVTYGSEGPVIQLENGMRTSISQIVSVTEPNQGSNN